MRSSFQRLLMLTEHDVLSLQAQAALGLVREPERSQFSHLLRHFLARFFNHESASANGDAKTRLIQIAFAAGLPGLLAAIYLWPDYHTFLPHVQKQHVVWTAGPPPYWTQVNQHFFFLVYSFVVMGMVAAFEWELCFPDLLDIFVLKPLPVTDGGTFLARVTAIAILLGGFLFDANILATLVLPAAIDPPAAARFLAAHVLACAGSGLFAAVGVLALECILLSVLGERYFRRVSLLVQGFLIAALLLALFLFPVFAGVVPTLLHSHHWYVTAIPPFWFLGIYQRLLEGPAALPIYGQLARTGLLALISVFAVALATYPIAYFRKGRQLVEGVTFRQGASWIGGTVSRILHASIVRAPAQRAVFDYITQTLSRVPRYRMYLVLYGGAGLSIVIAVLLRFSTASDKIQVVISTDGLYASTGIVAFWAVAGLRLAFLSPGNRHGSWIFHIVHGRPPEVGRALDLLDAVKKWVLAFVFSLVAAMLGVVCLVAPPGFLTMRAIAAQILAGAGVCVLLADLFFLDVTSVAFTNESTAESPNLAITVAKFFTSFLIVVSISLATPPWMEEQTWRYFLFFLGCVLAHRLITLRHREVVHQYCLFFDPENDENQLLLQLNLRDYGARSQQSRIV